MSNGGDRQGERTCRRAAIVAVLTLLLASALALALAACSDAGGGQSESGSTVMEVASPLAEALDAETIPPYAGEPSTVFNGDEPAFSDNDSSLASLEAYSPLDSLGRCGPAMTLIGNETMPIEPRGDIGEVRPTGFQIAKYPWIDGNYLYNRCHLIGYQLAGENANELNLITGTRSMNVVGMQPFENEVASYVRKTGNHVLYRVTPVFEGRNLVASGVLMEAQSVEDGGAGMRFCRWCWNVEPGVSIDYATGDNSADGTMTDPAAESGNAKDADGQDAGQTSDNDTAGADLDHAYILNTNSMKFHRPDCPSVADMSARNRQGFDGTRDEAISLGYEPCGVCKP